MKSTRRSYPFLAVSAFVVSVALATSGCGEGGGSSGSSRSSGSGTNTATTGTLPPDGSDTTTTTSTTTTTTLPADFGLGDVNVSPDPFGQEGDGGFLPDGNGGDGVSSPAPAVPEPATCVLLLGAVGALTAIRWRKTRRCA